MGGPRVLSLAGGIFDIPPPFSLPPFEIRCVVLNGPSTLGECCPSSSAGAREKTLSPAEGDALRLENPSPMKRVAP